MTHIGLLSDTHGQIDERILNFFQNCDEIWHAGDIGSMEVVNKLSHFKSFKAVYGNIDNKQIRNTYPEYMRFFCEGIDTLIIHIGGYPGRYSIKAKQLFTHNPPQLFISGHSHILKVMYDKNLNLLHINPGAAGNIGLHKVRTAIKFSIDKSDIKDTEILQLDKRS